jgi:hypothetical protein
MSNSVDVAIPPYHLPPKRASASAAPGGAGLHLSLVVHAAPGYSIPGSVVEQLSVNLPLALHSVSRFLSTHGFAPYLVRSSAVKLREECYKPSAQEYRVVFNGQRNGAEDSIRVRFHSFGREKVDLELHNVDSSGFAIEYDGEPGEESAKEVEEVGGAGSGLWRTRLSISTPVSGDGNGCGWNRRGSAASLLSPVSTKSNTPFSPSTPWDGCTLVISPSAVDPFLPVTVQISRPSTDSTTLPLARMKSASTAIAHASSALENPFSTCDSVEELLECSREGSEEHAEMLLKSARRIVTELEMAKERETAPSFYPPSWGRATSSSRRSRGGAPGSIILNSPFAASRKELPLSPQSYHSRLP